MGGVNLRVSTMGIVTRTWFEFKWSSSRSGLGKTGNPNYKFIMAVLL